MEIIIKGTSEEIVRLLMKKGKKDKIFNIKNKHRKIILEEKDMPRLHH